MFNNLNHPIFDLSMFNQIHKTMNTEDALQYLRELTSNDLSLQIYDECKHRLCELGYWRKNPRTGTSEWVIGYTKESVKHLHRQVSYSYE